MNKKMIIDGLSCENCPEKERCKEQQEKKDGMLLAIINYIKELTRPEYYKHLDILWENIPKITRCDVVLQKRLELKTAECEELKRNLIEKIARCNELELWLNGAHLSYDQIDKKLQIVTEALEEIKEQRLCEIGISEVEYKEMVNSEEEQDTILDWAMDTLEEVKK